jgi:hypothetical protein
MCLETNLRLLSKRGLETNFLLVYSCAVDQPIDRFVSPRAPANGDEDNAVYHETDEFMYQRRGSKRALL